jgi:hypothetical protein
MRRPAAQRNKSGAVSDGRRDAPDGQSDTRTKWLAGVTSAIVAGLVIALGTALINHIADGGHPEVDSAATTVAPDPLHVSATLASNAYAEGYEMVADKATTDTVSPDLADGCFSSHQQLVKAGAFDTSTAINLSISSSSASGVIINNISPKILSQGPSSFHTALSCASAEGEIAAIHLKLNLDEDGSTVREADESDPPGTGAPYFKDRSIEVRRGENLRVDIEAFAVDQSYEWVLVVDAVSDGRPVTLELDNAGVPFRTAPTAEAPSQRLCFSRTSRQGWADCS